MKKIRAWNVLSVHLRLAFATMAVGLVTSSSYGLAQEIEPSAGRLGPYYTSLPGPEQRAKATRANKKPLWLRLPYFKEQRLEVVKPGQLDDHYADLLANDQKFRTWAMRSGVHLPQFKWLNLRNLDVGSAAVKKIFTGGNGSLLLRLIEIPIAFDVRYAEKGSWTHQGTLYAQGRVEVVARGDGFVEDVQVIAFDDSQRLERWGRKIGFISQFDQQFIRAVAEPLLESFFSDPTHLQKLLQLGDALSESSSPISHPLSINGRD